MDEWTIKTQNPSAFLSVDLLPEFAAFCFTDFLDWRYIHSWFVFSTQLVNCCPHGRRNYMVFLYCGPSTVPSLWPPHPSPPSQCTVYTDSVLLWGVVGGCWNILWTIFCRSFTLCFWPDSKPTKLIHHPQTKMTSKDDIKGLVSLKFFRPWFNPILTHQGWIWLCLVWGPKSITIRQKNLKKIKFYHVGLVNILLNSHKAEKLTIS
jgi:hypothetical protein